MQVMTWFAGPARASTLTRTELRSIASLMPRYRVPGTGASATDPGAAAVVLAVDVLVIMQLDQQSKFVNPEVPQFLFIDRVPDIPAATQ